MTQTPAPDPLVKLMLGVIVLMSGAVVSIIVLAVYSQPWTGPADDQCDVSRPDEEVCDADQWCIRGTCRARPVEEYAGVDESCRDMECEPPHLNCGADLQCHPDDGPLPPPLHCEDRRVLRAVEQLAAKCSQRTHDITALGEDPMGCSSAVWKDLTASDADIDLLLSAFPDRFAVTFPRAQPQVRARWPEDRGAFLLEQMRPFKQRLASAHKIFVIGRASPDGDSQKNYALTLRRIDMFERTLKRLLQEGQAPSAASSAPMFLSWGVAREELLSLRSFVRNYVGAHPPFAFDATSQTRLRDGLRRFSAGEALPPAALRELEQAVNRAVIVIPVLCNPQELTRR